MADQDKTEKPTPRRLREVRRKGTTPRSGEISTAIGMIVIAVMVPSTVGRLYSTFTGTWIEATQMIQRPALSDAELLLRRSSMESVRALVPLVVTITATSVIAQLAFIGGKPNLHVIKPKFKAMNPITNLKNIFGKQIAFQLGKTAAKIAAVALVGYTMWRSAAVALTANAMSVPAFLQAMTSSTRDLILRITLLAVLIAVVDATMAKRRYNKQIRMSKTEIRDEMRQNDGDPHVKGEIRKRQAKMSRLRMMAAVAQADVVLTNPTHLAVALKYDEDSPAPIVVAKGAGFVAQRIRGEEARKHGVPVMENKPLARALHRSVEIGQAIPVDLYRAVAEVLASIYRMRRGGAARARVA